MLLKGVWDSDEDMGIKVDFDRAELDLLSANLIGMYRDGSTLRRNERHVVELNIEVNSHQPTRVTLTVS